MAKNGNSNGNGKGAPQREMRRGERVRERHLHPETTRSIWAVALLGLAIILCLAGFHRAGPGGEWIFFVLNLLFGVGYLLLPISLFLVSIVLIFTDRQRVVLPAIIGLTLLVLASLGAIDVVADGTGGYLGRVLGSLKIPFGSAAALILNGVVFVVSLLVIFNAPIKLRLPERKPKVLKSNPAKEPTITGVSEATPEEAAAAEEHLLTKAAADKQAHATASSSDSAQDKSGQAAKKEEKQTEEELPQITQMSKPKRGELNMKPFKNYVPPPMELLQSSVEKPTTGDLRANANIIKRTLESFGVIVEMGEINIGPKVTRYTMKPAEGMKLSRITSLQSDLALALAAHPIRIEAPIPGKSLVGIEVPNKAAAIVRLGNLISYPEFQTSGHLGFVLGRDVNGDPIFENIEKMPHLLVAGATGSGKSILIHSLIISLLYKNSPSTLRFVMIDPKRVELSAYAGLPHLAMPVVIENKKALAIFRYAVQEMERRYELLSAAGRRDITSYNEKCEPEDIMPFLVIVVDELADLMTSYGKEVEGSIIRLAQMARATGIHLVLSTQRPSVEVITGLIKANITNRVALQVASQIDSRTILDMSGAEDLLGGGDLLFISPKLSKPKRIQGAYISEEEINKVTEYIRENNKTSSAPILDVVKGKDGEAAEETGEPVDPLEEYMEDEDDSMFEDAVEVVASAKKASASLLQRRLKVGYARAARLLDLMEAKGIIGPGDGAKPREVYLDQLPDQTQ